MVYTRTRGGPRHARNRRVDVPSRLRFIFHVRIDIPQTSARIRELHFTNNPPGGLTGLSDSRDALAPINPLPCRLLSLSLSLARSFLASSFSLSRVFTPTPPPGAVPVVSVRRGGQPSDEATATGRRFLIVVPTGITQTVLVEASEAWI